MQVFKLRDGHDVAGDRLGHLLLLLALEQVDMPGLGTLAGAEFDETRVGSKPSGQDTQIAELAHELIVDRFEYLGDQRAVLSRQDLLFRRIGLGAPVP